MEEVEGWDDGERPLVILEETVAESSDIADPLGTEMVAVTSDFASTEAQVQGSSTPRVVQTPDSSVQIPEMVPETSGSGSGKAAKTNSKSNDTSADKIQASLNNALATSDMISTQNTPWMDQSWGEFLSASTEMPTITPLLTTLSEQERAKLITEMIINCIRRQTSLWDSSDPKFGDSKLCPLLWNNIASVCGLDVKKLKKKWAKLKKTYKTEYIKCTTKGVSSKSRNYVAMSFLEREIALELQREDSEKEYAKQQLKKLQDGINRLETAGSPVLLDSGDDEDGAEDDDDCVIVESEQYQAARNTLRRTLDSGILKTSPTPSSPIAEVAAPEGAPKTLGGIRVRDTSELITRKPESSQCSNPSSSSDCRNSPEVVCLQGESFQSNPKKVLYSTAAGNKPTIKFSTPKPITVAQEVGEGLLKNRNTNDSYSATPNEVKRCARKSTSRANLTLFSACNGESDTKSTKNSMNLKLKTETNDSVLWKIENPRTVDPSLPCVKPEQILEVEFPQSIQVDIDPVKVESTSEEDDIQIIKEVPGWSSKQVRNLEQTPPQKKPRLSDSKVLKRKVDKTRENSANEHFLLSLLCDVETLTNEQFRRLKKHSTALASMILDSKK